MLVDSFVILYVMARDEDEGENGRVSYRFQAGNGAGRFSLNPNTGKSLTIYRVHNENIHSIVPAAHRTKYLK